MSEAPELKPCPFCGKNPYKNVKLKGGGFRVMCAWCEATGAQVRNDKAMAVDDWNTRPDLELSVSVVTMKLSGNRKEYYTRITCDGRSFDVRRYGNEFHNRAEYEADELRHVLLGEPKPDLMDPRYADKEKTHRLDKPKPPLKPTLKP